MKNKFKFLALAIMALLSVNVWGADVAIASWGAVSMAANTNVNASSYQGTTAPKMQSNKAMTSSATNAYYGSSAGGATITISGLPSGYKTKSVSFYSRASQGGNFTVSYSTNGGTSYTSAGTSSTLSTGGTPAQYTVTFSSAVSNVTNIKFVHSKSSGSLYFGTVVVTGEADAGGGDDEDDSDTYVKATELSDLCVGAKVIIAASGYDFAMSETQNSNNRGQAAITKNGNNATWTTAATDVEEFTLGKTGNYYTFKDKSNRYIYAASSSNNYLKSQATNDANGEWTISISDGVATIQSHGTYTHNVMQYNQSSSLFACYTSASQKALAIYVKDGDCSSCTAISPTLSYTSAATIGQVLNPTLDKKGSSGAVTYSIKSGGSYASINASTGALTCTAAGTVTVQATIAAAGDYCEGTATSNTITISEPSYTITATKNDASLGNVSLSGKVITATPNACVGYDNSAYTVSPAGKATVAQSGNIFTVSNVTADVTVTINFAELEKDTYVDHLHDNDTIEKCGSYTAPSLNDATKATTGDCDVVHYHFAGWVTNTISTGTSSAPSGMITTGTAMNANGTTYYAVWAKEE